MPLLIIADENYSGQLDKLWHHVQVIAVFVVDVGYPANLDENLGPFLHFVVTFLSPNRLENQQTKTADSILARMFPSLTASR